jgi:hypothetical protein
MDRISSSRQIELFWQAIHADIKLSSDFFHDDVAHHDEASSNGAMGQE